MGTLRILVVEGCSEEVLFEQASIGLAFSSKVYADSLRLNADNLMISTAYPYAPHRNQHDGRLNAFDGFVLTGSAVAWGAESEEALPYLDFLAEILETGKPVLGSCWGMQTVAVLLGGMSGPNPKGSEIGVAREITLTNDGIVHTLFQDMPPVFSSPAYHRDHVTKMPEGAVLLASNAISDVQAMAYQTNGVDYMGFQFHPEIPLEHFHSEYKKRAALPGTIAELVDFPDKTPPEIADAKLRTRPLRNWLKHVETITGAGIPDNLVAPNANQIIGS